MSVGENAGKKIGVVRRPKRREKLHTLFGKELSLEFLHLVLVVQREFRIARLFDGKQQTEICLITEYRISNCFRQLLLGCRQPKSRRERLLSGATVRSSIFQSAHHGAEIGRFLSVVDASSLA